MSEERRIPDEEERLLTNVQRHLAEAAAAPRSSAPPPAYDKQLIALRDEIAESRLEDVPALLAQMERISGVAARRAEVTVVPVDAKSPYFAHMRLREGGRDRDVLIGRTTHIDARSGVRIVDWRHAPVSQLYYRYAEGASYEETFGDRDVEGEMVVRRTVTIHDGTLVRVQAPQGTYVRRSADSEWRHIEARATELGGGQGTASRPAPRGVLGIGPDGDQRMDRHLPEIAALLDPRQFELISAPEAGVVVIQGGAGSGKTTIGLHRMAYLAYRDRERFGPDRMMVVTSGPALSSYISEVLPSLGVPGVRVTTFTAFAESQRRSSFRSIDVQYEEDTPLSVTRLKKHPAVLRLLAARAPEMTTRRGQARDEKLALTLWSEVLTDLEALKKAVAEYTEIPLTERDLQTAHRWCTERAIAVTERFTREEDHEPAAPEEARPRGLDDETEESHTGGDDEPAEDMGVDGVHIDDDLVRLDREDDALLLRAYQLVVGPLKRGKHVLSFEHLFVDEAQDLAPLELAVLLGTVTVRRSVTFAGDTAQKLFLDNGFRDWRSTLNELGLSSTEIEPLRIAYRSTKEVMGFARHVLGPLADTDPPIAPRTGAPVEGHTFPHTGAAVAFLADALRPLFAREPRATVGIISRFAEQADAYYDGLVRSEVPNLRRVRAQDFTFKPGIDVTDIRQVKGLEFDYVVVVDVSASSFPDDEHSRHLLHIAATRAAHQLWIIVTGPASPLLPPAVAEG